MRGEGGEGIEFMHVRILFPLCERERGEEERERERDYSLFFFFFLFSTRREKCVNRPPCHLPF